MKIALLVATTAMLLAIGTSYAQNAYFPEGKGGHFVNASFFQRDGFDGYGAGFGLDVLGSMAVGLEFGRINRTGVEEIAWDDFEETGVAPFMSMLVLRPSRTLPVGIEAKVNYIFSVFKGDHVDAIDREAHGNSISGGLDVFGVVPAGRLLDLWLRVGFGYSAWGIGNQVAALDVDNNEEVDDLELFDIYDLPQYVVRTGLAARIGGRLVLSLDRVEYDNEEPVLELGMTLLWVPRPAW